MNRLILTATGLAWLCIGCARAQELESAVTYIQVSVIDPFTQARRPLTTGSGFLIDRRGYIITARHVAMAKKTEEPGERWIGVSLRHKDASPVPAQIVACEFDNIDLCLIKVSDASVAAANITEVFSPSCRHLSHRESITAYGYPYGAANPVIGVPGEITGDLAFGLKYPSNVQIIPGMSGGPVVDASGQTVAVNVGAAADMPTMTFLQPLIYGDALVRRAGLACNAPVPTLAKPVICEDRQHRIDRMQLSFNDAEPSVREYNETIQADTGCRIASVTPVVRSGNNATGPTVNIGPDGEAAIVTYSLRSGPFYDRYRGWLDAELTVKQTVKAPKP